MPISPPLPIRQRRTQRCLPVLLLVFLWCLLAAAQAAGAADLARTLAQREHTAWTERNGAPERVSAFAQTADGWLWLGTPRGLFRFDGKRFEQVRPAFAQRFPDTDVYTLQADPGGGLWIGWRTGGISHLRDGAVRNWSADDGLPHGSIWGFAVDGPGLWAAGLDGLAWFDGHAWKRIGKEQGFGARKASSVFVAADGTVAVLSELGLFLREPGAQRFTGPVGKLDTRQPFLQRRNADGSAGPLFLLEKRGIRIVDRLQDYERLGHPWIARQRGPVTGSMLVDRSGALWYDDDRSLNRIADPARAAALPGRYHAPGAESFGTAQGLSGRTIHCMFEDGDGNIWVGTNAGIDRFRATNIVQVKGAIEGRANLAPAPGTGMVATDGERAWRLRHDRGAERLPGTVGDVLAPGLRGDLWIGGLAGLTRRSADGLRVLEEVRLPPRFSPIGKIHALAQGADGSVWMSAIGGGAWRYRDGRWERPAMLPRQGEKTPLSMLADSRGRVWFGYIDNQVVVLDGERTRSFGKEQGLEVGKVALLTEYGGSVLAGGADGLARFDGTRFRPVAARPAQALGGLSGAVAGPGGLWLNGAAGVVRLDGTGRARIFDERDGLRDRSGILNVGTMARAADGRIWMSTAAGVSWLDPAHIAPDPKPHKTSLLRVAVDGKVHDAGPSLVLPPAPGRMSFAFASPALSMPERIRYRYRLEGYDRDWQQAGADTEATYTGLPPGSYRFVAQALNGDGVAGPQSDPLSVQVTPSLTQTAWFRAACALLAAALLWGLYRYRLHVQARRLLAIEHTRQAERERIARELHDTLLQGVQGLIFIFDAAAQSTAQEALRAKLDAALARARGLVAEARDRVHGLRAGDRTGVDLAPMLAGLAARIGAEYKQEIAFTVEGEPPHVDGELAETCARIAEEALRNACRHGAARHVGMVLGQAARQLTLVVRDDGIGIDGDVTKAGKPGHWGLTGMHERALLAGGRLDIVAGAGQGTELRLQLPLAAAERGEREWPDSVALY